MSRVDTTEYLHGSKYLAVSSTSVALERQGDVSADLTQVNVRRTEVHLAAKGLDSAVSIRLSINDAVALGDALIRAAGIARKESER